jgi:Lrp/AsnC family transcriptional regulator for asnA, asnC and gidA
MDSVDLKLIRILNQDSRTPLRQLGREVGLSTSGVKRRLDRLSKLGVIQRYSVVVDPKKYGLGTVAFVRVEVDPKFMRELAHSLERKREVCEIHRITGGDYLMLKIRARSVDELNDFVERNLASKDHVKSVAPLISMEAYKEVLFVP